MEAAAGVPLFVRNARGVSPSAAGTAVVARAGRILADVDSLRRDLDGLGDRLAGRVRWACSPPPQRFSRRAPSPGWPTNTPAWRYD